MNGEPTFILNGEELPIVFTKHAADRCRMWRLPFDVACEMLREAIPEKKVTRSKYKDDPDIRHFRNGTVIFSGKRTTDKFHGDMIFLVLTVFDQRMWLR